MSKLLLLDINKTVEIGSLMEVTNGRLPEKNKYIPGSLWDPIIFGKPGSGDRSSKFAYIDLKGNYIHPTALPIIQTVSTETSRIINNKGSYIVKDEKYVEDEFGDTGLSFLLSTINDVDFEKFAHKHKEKEALYIEKNKKEILIDKWIVIPPSPIRDIDIFKQKGLKSNSEINVYYGKLIFLSNNLIGDDMLDSSIKTKIQQTLTDLTLYIVNANLKGKRGLFRSKVLKKTLDFSSMLVLTSSPNIPLGYVGVPFTTLVTLYEPHLTYYKKTHPEVDMSIKSYLGIDLDDELSFDDYITFTHKTITKFHHTIKGEIADVLFNAMKNVCKDEWMLVKRNPTDQRNNWYVGKIIPTMEHSAVVLNSMDLPAIGGEL